MPRSDCHLKARELQHLEAKFEKLIINFDAPPNLSRACPRRDLNLRPLPYQGSALPLSYKGNFKVGRVGPFMIACSTMILKCAE